MFNPKTWPSAAFVLFTAAALSGPAFAQGEEKPVAGEQDAAKEKKISTEMARELIEVSGVVRTSEEVLAQSASAFDALPFLPEGFAERFREEFDGEALDRDLTALIVEHVKPKAAASAIAFYSTESGQVWKATMREIDEESFAQSQSLGEELAMAIMSGTDVPPIPEREEPEEGSDEAKLQSKLDEVLTLLKQRDIIQSVLELSLEPLGEMGAPEELIDGLRRELNADRVLAILWPLLLERVDEKLLDDVLKWARTDDAQAFVANTVTLTPEATRIGQLAGQEAGERAMGG